MYDPKNLPPSAYGWALLIAIATAATIPVLIHPAAACRTAATAMEMHKSYGCFEFWLNRYQTLIAALIAAGVALFVVRPVFEQLRQMNRQAAAASKQIATETALEFENEIKSLSDIRTASMSIRALLRKWDNNKLADIYQEWPDAALEAISVMVKATEFTNTANIRSLGPFDVMTARKKVLTCTQRICSRLGDMYDVADSLIDEALHDGGTSFSKDDQNAARNELWSALALLQEPMKDYESKLGAAAKISWNKAKEHGQVAQEG